MKDSDPGQYSENRGVVPGSVRRESRKRACTKGKGEDLGLRKEVVSTRRRDRFGVKEGGTTTLLESQNTVGGAGWGTPRPLRTGRGRTIGKSGPRLSVGGSTVEGLTGVGCPCMITGVVGVGSPSCTLRKVVSGKWGFRDGRRQ